MQDRRQHCLRQINQLKQRLIPAAVLYIVYPETRGVGFIRSRNSGQRRAHIVLWVHNIPHPGKQLRLIFTHPQDLSRRTGRKHPVVGELEQSFHAARTAVNLAVLLFISEIDTTDNRPQRPQPFVERHKAMHLAGQPDGVHAATGRKAARQSADASKGRAAQHRGGLVVTARPGTR